jgi:phosphatidylinositol alpha-1,6-mannosyltransferase
VIDARQTGSRRRVIVASTEFFAPGGVQRVGRQMIAALGPVADVEAWSLCDSAVAPADPVAGLATFRLGAGSDWQLGAWALEAAARRGADDVLLLVHANLAPIALPWTMRQRRTVVFLHGVEAWRRLSPVARTVLARADLVANSAYTAEQFTLSNPEFSREDVAVCALGVEPQALDAAGGEDGGLALSVSRLSREDAYKGHERLIRVWPAVRAQVAAASLVIVGDGDDRGRLERLARDSGLASTIRFAGRVGDDELEGWYRRCALFVLPSPREGFGLVFLEAMRAGKPCVASPGAAESIVADGVTGLLVRSDADAPLVAALVQLFRDGALRRRLGDAGRQRFLDRFTLARFAERLRRLVLTDRAA